LSAGLSPFASPVKPSSRLKPLAGQQLPGLGSVSTQQQQQQQEEVDVAIDVSRLAPPSTAAAAAGASSISAGVPGSAAGGVVVEGPPAGQEAAGAEGYKFSVEGMSCGSCVRSVEAAVAKVRTC
jgi:hypothetical protein